MKKPLPLTDAEGEVRELTTEDFKRFKPAIDVLPASLLKKLASSNELQHPVSPVAQSFIGILQNCEISNDDY